MLTKGSACVQALATGNLDQAPPEFRDVLVPLHVRFSLLLVTLPRQNDLHLYFR